MVGTVRVVGAVEADDRALGRARVARPPALAATSLAASSLEASRPSRMGTNGLVVQIRRQPLWRRIRSSSGAVICSLSGSAMPPAATIASNARTHSGWLGASSPTTSPSPRPLWRRPAARARACWASVPPDQTSAPSGRWAITAGAVGRRSRRSIRQPNVRSAIGDRPSAGAPPATSGTARLAPEGANRWSPQSAARNRTSPARPVGRAGTGLWWSPRSPAKPDRT